MRLFKAILAVIAVLLFPFGYWICLYFYPDDVVKFFDLRMNLYACILLLCFTVCRLQCNKKYLMFIFDIGIGMSGADILDRLYFDVTKFEDSDITMCFLVILGTLIDYNKVWIHSIMLKLKPYHWICQKFQK